MECVRPVGQAVPDICEYAVPRVVRHSLTYEFPPKHRIQTPYSQLTLRRRPVNIGNVFLHGVNDGSYDWN